jgi:hypothetical protein
MRARERVDRTVSSPAKEPSGACTSEALIDGVAIHDDPESCAVSRKAGREALTKVCAGAVLSCESGAPGRRRH